MGRHTSIAVRMALVTMLVFGVIYPLAMTGVAQVLFPRQANGSLIIYHGTVIGSELIGQQFTGQRYFHPRPSAAGTGYDASASGGSNLGPTSRAFVDGIRGEVASAANQNPGLVKGQVPVDMVTASGSGLDPDISIANAYAQAPRVAKARVLPEAAVKALIDKHIAGRTAGFLGEPRISVLDINRTLDAMGRRAR